MANKMDFFAQLPPEIRIRIMGQMSSKSAISRIIQASPAMLAQWIQSRKTIVRAVLINLVGGDIYGDILHDALAIIHMPPIDSSSTGSIINHVGLWLTKTLSDPFEQNDSKTLDTLYRLFSRLAVFIEDFMTKATAPFPPRAYLCLPRMTSLDGELYFRDQSIDARHVELDDLTCSERNRFLRAFVRYELLCKLYAPRLWKILEPSEYGDQVKQSHSDLHIWEYEMVHCVREYARSIYVAMFANFTDSWLPNSQTASGSEKKFLYPDTYWTNPNVFFANLDLPRSCYHSASLDELSEQDRLVKLKFRYPEGEQQRRRSQKWQDFFAGRKSDDDFEWQDDDDKFERVAGERIVIPRLFERPVTERMIPFWRYGMPVSTE
ncbi:hypothetical protein CEP54_010548 [Fusarium duplospermum]|uniref:Uncharacterized protein n=1 Tax=Fusarium duplospermum TaxID=1325734 RepID=A0A428PJB1_9HYPO|nr:hypothetical protein CEP54_010548 [Fusarium duplospermum]